MSTESCTCLEEDKELGLSLSLWCFPEGFAELFRFYFSSWKEILKYLLTLALFHWERWVNCVRLLFRSGHSRRRTDKQRQEVHTYHGKFHALSWEIREGRWAGAMWCYGRHLIDCQGTWQQAAVIALKPVHLLTSAPAASQIQTW